MRERYPIGYVGSPLSFAGASTDVNSAAVGSGVASDISVAGYFGVNDVDNVQASQTATAHTHNVTVTPVTRTEPDIIGVNATYAANTSVTSTSTSNGATTTDISPRSAVVGFMIYLGNASLQYYTGSLGGGGPIG